MGLLILHSKISSGILCDFTWQILRENIIWVKVVKTLISNYIQHVEDWKVPMMQKCNSLKHCLLITRMHWWYSLCMFECISSTSFNIHTLDMFYKIQYFFFQSAVLGFFLPVNGRIVKMDHCNGKLYSSVESVLI